MQIRFRLAQQMNGFGDLSLLNHSPGTVNAAQNLAFKSRRGTGNDPRLFQTCLGIAHSGVQVGELSALNLLSPIIGQIHVQRLADVAEWLPRHLGMFFQAFCLSPRGTVQ